MITDNPFETAEPRGKRVRRVILSLLGTVICLGIGGLMIWDGRQIADARDFASDWKETTGRIVKFDDRSTRRNEETDVRFSFFVRGRQVHGTRLSIAGGSGGWFRSSYELGDEVPVYYHPRYPQHAVLDRTAYPAEIKSYVIGGASAMLPLAIFVGTKIERRRKRRDDQDFVDSIDADLIET